MSGIPPGAIGLANPVAGPPFAQLLQILTQLVTATNAQATIISGTSISGALAGDVTGTASATTVVGTHLAAPLPTSQGGTGNGTGAPGGGASGDLGGAYPSPTVVQTHLSLPLPTGQGGTGNTTGAPSGPATGDLSGAYPSPAVVVTHLSAPLPEAQGGTGAATLAAALTTLGITYTTGPWTPVLAFGGLSTGITYGTRHAIYTKIGSLVCCLFKIILTSNGSATGVATIAGLPSPSSADVANDGAGGICSFYAAMAGLSGVPLLKVGAASSMVSLLSAGAAATAALDDTAFTATSTLSGNFAYFA